MKNANLVELRQKFTDRVKIKWVSVPLCHFNGTN